MSEVLGWSRRRTAYNRLVYRIFPKPYLQSGKLFRKNTFYTEENAFTAGQKISTG